MIRDVIVGAISICVGVLVGFSLAGKASFLDGKLEACNSLTKVMVMVDPLMMLGPGIQCVAQDGDVYVKLANQPNALYTLDGKLK